jgi:glycosyltransferase involved in cell wall biosynthesis
MGYKRMFVAYFVIYMRIIALVSNDLNQDQRMHRICNTLTQAGHQVMLVGRVRAGSVPLRSQAFSMVRLKCWFERGPFFYAEYQLRLFSFLLVNSFDAINAVDLDTLPAGLMSAKMKGKPCIFDAHEYYEEVPELINRPMVKQIWSWIGRACVPMCASAYTVGPKLAEIFSDLYKLPFGVVRNMPNKYELRGAEKTYLTHTELPYILYQGALNIGRGLTETIAAMQEVDGLRLLIAGSGDIADQLKKQVIARGLDSKVVFLGNLMPRELQTYTQRAWLGINLLEPLGLSYQFSLANKFFDYIQAGVPSICVDFPEYRNIVNQYKVSHLILDIKPQTIAEAIKYFQGNEKAHREMRQACFDVSEQFCWETEGKILLKIWSIVFIDTLEH